MKASDYIASFLHGHGIDYVFELSGGMITHIIDSIHRTTPINIVTVHHEQAAAFAADAYGRVTGKPGVALATSGPGATNLLTGIGSCYFDSSPAVFITGQVNRNEQKGDRPIRQLGFQETDIIAMASPITKACYKVTKASELPAILRKAFKVATSGRPGPVLIDVPMDVQRENIAEEFLRPEHSQPETSDFSAELERLYLDIEKSERPLVLAGRGVKVAFAQEELQRFLDIVQVPVVTTLLAVDAIPFSNAHRAGFIGSYGNRWANRAFGECDLLIVLGSRLDIRQTGADTRFFENRKIYHVDCEEGEINNRVLNCIPLPGDVGDFLRQAVKAYTGRKFSPKKTWRDNIRVLAERWPDTAESKASGINPNAFMHVLSQASAKAAAFVADVGAHQMWAAQSLELVDSQLFLTSGGMGAMGFALPASVGACLALGRQPVVAIIGDGSMQINIQELQTVVRNKLPIKIVVINNRNLGMIRQFQESYFNSRFQSTYWGYTVPDFEKVANAYGIPAMTISDESEVSDAVAWLWSGERVNSPVLLQVMIDPLANVYPKIAFGRPITEMEPDVKPVDMEGT